MTEKKKKAFDRLMSVPVMEYDLASDLSKEILVRLLIEYTVTAGKITFLQESPDISEKTRQCLEGDLERLAKKHQLVSSRLGQGGAS